MPTDRCRKHYWRLAGGTAPIVRCRLCGSVKHLRDFSRSELIELVVGLLRHITKKLEA